LLPLAAGLQGVYGMSNGSADWRARAEALWREAVARLEAVDAAVLRAIDRLRDSSAQAWADTAHDRDAARVAAARFVARARRRLVELSEGAGQAARRGATATREALGRSSPIVQRHGQALAAAPGSAATRLGASLRNIAARLRRSPIRTWHLAGAIGGVMLAASLLYSNCGFQGCPDVRQLTAWQPGGAPVLLDRNGERFADLAPYERAIVALDSLPEHVSNAFIAVEDRRFWDHDGVDWRRVFGAALANAKSRGVTQGSSTISMQLARNVFPERLPGTERTFRRKLQEARVARQIEDRFEKREILEMYLNHIYFGGGAYGIEAAARLYFGKGADKLTLAESATLAALPKAPSHYDPRRRPERSVERRDLVLALMAAQALADSADIAKAVDSKLAVRTDGRRDRTGVPLGPFFIDIVRDQLEDRFGEELYRSRLRIHTTLDQVAQRAAERELENQLKSLDSRVRAGEGELQGSVVLLEAATGHVLALVGGRDPLTTRYNRAIHGRRQIGSAFKPFVFAAALEEGVPTSMLVSDMPLRMQLSRNDVWEPSNYDGTYEGNVSLRHALVRSRNIPTVRLASSVGIGDVAKSARTAGVVAAMDETPALALGTVAMSPLQLATAYTTFATLGETAQPRFIVRVEDESGTILWEPVVPQPARGMDPGVAFIVTDILRDALDIGTGTGVRTAGFRGPAAGKTGTTNNATDAWFVGYTPEIVGAVWIGYDKPSPLGGAATGGGFAAPVWGRVMRQVYAQRAQPREWQAPAGVVRRHVDPNSGLLLESGCQTHGGNVGSELFTASNLPATTCPYRDFWSDLWRRVGGGPREMQGPPPPPPPRGGARSRDQAMDEYLQQRSEQLRRQAEQRARQEERRAQQRGRGRGN
jgi:1A family penicillin-binding protein